MSSSFSKEKASDKMAIGEFGLEKIETHVLKVHVNCIGCRQRVKKILRKIDGVYGVNIDPEKELVTVHGTVDSEILVQKLARSGKHAEVVCSNKVKDKKQNHGMTSLAPNLGKNMQMHSFFDSADRNWMIPEENAANEQLLMMSYNDNGDNTSVYHHHNGPGVYNPLLGGFPHYGYGNQDRELLNQNMFVSGGPRTMPMRPTFPIVYQVADHHRFN